MILVDKEIKNRSETIFIKGYDEKFVQPISYDIHIETIITDSDEVDTYLLKPNNTVMVRCKEEIKVPNDLAIKVENKNSLLRAGITIAAPVYNPGHQTPVYLRVENISANNFELVDGMNIAQLIFEKLSDIPEITYNKKTNASFNNEKKYARFGNYAKEYERQIKKINEAKKELEDKEYNVYSNILTMMGIFVSIFSLIVINFGSLSEKNITGDYLLKMNLSLGVIITLFIGLIMIFIRKRDNKLIAACYVIVLFILVVILFLTCLK